MKYKADDMKVAYRLPAPLKNHARGLGLKTRAQAIDNCVSRDF